MEPRDLYLRSICKKPEIHGLNSYVAHLPLVQRLDTLEFHQPVTFLVGENGSGKSTLLEAIAVAWGFNPEGGSRNFNFSTQQTHSPLAQYLKLVRGPYRAKDGFFLRAESFYNVATEIDRLDTDGTLVRSYGGISLHGQSHGESFLSLMLHRFGGQGLYLLDEPESALFPHPPASRPVGHPPAGAAGFPVHHRHPFPYPHGLPPSRDLGVGRRRAPCDALPPNRALSTDPPLFGSAGKDAGHSAGGRLIHRMWTSLGETDVPKINARRPLHKVMAAGRFAPQGVDQPRSTP